MNCPFVQIKVYKPQFQKVEKKINSFLTEINIFFEADLVEKSLLYNQEKYILDLETYKEDNEKKIYLFPTARILKLTRIEKKINNFQANIEIFELKQKVLKLEDKFFVQLKPNTDYKGKLLLFLIENQYEPAFICYDKKVDCCCFAFLAEEKTKKFVFVFLDSEIKEHLPILIVKQIKELTNLDICFSEKNLFINNDFKLFWSEKN